MLPKKFQNRFCIDVFSHKKKIAVYAAIFSILIRVYGCLCPTFRRYRDFDLYLMTETFLVRSCSSTVADTFAPLRVGVPTCVVVPSSSDMSNTSKLMLAPTSKSSFSILSSCPSRTRYCFPPVWITASVAIAVFPRFLRVSNNTSIPASLKMNYGGRLLIHEHNVKNIAYFQIILRDKPRRN